MIDYIVGGEYLNVTSNKGAQPYINMSSSQAMVGALSYDPSIGQMKVYDGNSWMSLGGGSAVVNLDPDAIRILNWAKKRMLEEAERERLAETNTTIRDLMDQIKQKEEQLSIVLTLIKEEEKV
jgi:uncharacterized spore protein YtfJ